MSVADISVIVSVLAFLVSFASFGWTVYKDKTERADINELNTWNTLLDNSPGQDQVLKNEQQEVANRIRGKALHRQFTKYIYDHLPPKLSDKEGCDNQLKLRERGPIRFLNWLSVGFTGGISFAFIFLYYVVVYTKSAPGQSYNQQAAPFLLLMFLIFFGVGICICLALRKLWIKSIVENDFPKSLLAAKLQDDYKSAAFQELKDTEENYTHLKTNRAISVNAFMVGISFPLVFLAAALSAMWKNNAILHTCSILGSYVVVFGIFLSLIFLILDSFLSVSVKENELGEIKEEDKVESDQKTGGADEGKKCDKSAKKVV
ncbi:hypothetical protein [Bifidobacterium sp. ESL0790]|uniref:hypothetical protein n=1 Tax=Bifidobacterium sp. ESL0790 TaxID=2983233 RepID=UPI0023F79E42|nr:hypothetical protein [Bifidobacterium sp. ESL0790]WEV73012.1 hypothetical protein OZY47_03430 [Bifidobacterium sp. ESL0790]